MEVRLLTDAGRVLLAKVTISAILVHISIANLLSSLAITLQENEPFSSAAIIFVAYRVGRQKYIKLGRPNETDENSP